MNHSACTINHPLHKWYRQFQEKSPNSTVKNVSNCQQDNNSTITQNQAYEQLAKDFKIIRDNSTIAQHQFISKT